MQVRLSHFSVSASPVAVLKLRTCQVPETSERTDERLWSLQHRVRALSLVRAVDHACLLWVGRFCAHKSPRFACRFLLCLTALMGGSPVPNLMGYFVGHAYWFLKEVPAPTPYALCLASLSFFDTICTSFAHPSHSLTCWRIFHPRPARSNPIRTARARSYDQPTHGGHSPLHIF